MIQCDAFFSFNGKCHGDTDWAEFFFNMRMAHDIVSMDNEFLIFFFSFPNHGFIFKKEKIIQITQNKQNNTSKFQTINHDKVIVRAFSDLVRLDKKRFGKKEWKWIFCLLVSTHIHFFSIQYIKNIKKKIRFSIKYQISLRWYGQYFCLSMSHN